jgi:signal transduction histidine kinase
MSRNCSEIGDDLQALSHQLHSSNLEYLGLAAALKNLCLEFSKQREASVDFVERDVPGDLPQDISLCLFRVAQEALHNAVKYSQTSRFAMTLGGAPGELRLEVRDWGVGFDVKTAMESRGLGLASMEERVNLVRGRYSIKSSPGEGTTITAVVPLVAESQSISETDGPLWPRVSGVD